MLRDKQKKLSSLVIALFICMFSTHQHLRADLTSLAKNDAIPMFSTLNWDEAHLLTKQQLEYKDYDWAEKKGNHVNISLSPFAQNADRGKSIKGQNCVIPFPFTDACGATIVDTPLGDLTGRTGMIPLLYNTNNVWPGGKTTADEAFAGKPTLLAAYTALFSGQSTFNSEGNIDPTQLFGYFSFPEKYRKRGMRFEMAINFAKYFGFRIQAGVSTIRQVREATINLTDNPADKFTPVTPTLTPSNVDLYLMNQLDIIANEIDISLCDFIKSSMEEVRFYVYWRQAIEMNQETDSDWAKFLLIPYIEAGGSISPGKKENDHNFFEAPFGNNGHPSVGFTAGLNIDFRETIEIGGEVGYTHFFKKDFCRPIPNNKFQTNLFPFSTEVSVNPGANWYFGARLAAYHFLENLSMYFEWFVLDHQKDEICLKNPDPAFVPGTLECTTSFKTKLGNAGFNYDLSPNVGVGFLWQIPFSQRNSYRSSTIMAGLNVTF